VPTGTVAVSGIAIHPNGDVLVGNNATAAVETLFALFRDGPFNANASPTRSEDWKKTVAACRGAGSWHWGSGPRTFTLRPTLCRDSLR